MLDIREEERYARVRELCRELKVPPPFDVFVNARVTDQNNRVIHDDTQRAHSWTRNFYNTLVCAACGAEVNTGAYAAGSTGQKVNNGTVRPAYTSDYDNRVDIITIRIGSSSTPFTINDWALSEIASGNGSGQLLNTIGKTISSVTYANKIWTAVFYAVWNNNSGSTVTVRESGLYTSDRAGNLERMVERTVLNPETPVINSCQFTLTYTTTVDMSAID